ncbi:hypothetical protein ACVWZZ_002596 [Bradyrhizobium sp. LM6.10]
MTKADDSSLEPEDLRAVEERARQLLDRASAWDRFPVPLEDILAAANVRVAQTSLFDPVAVMEYLAGKAIQTATVVKSALGKLFGLYDSADTLIHIDDSAIKSKSKKTFLTLHEKPRITIFLCTSACFGFSKIANNISILKSRTSLNARRTTLPGSPCLRATLMPGMPLTVNSTSRHRSRSRKNSAHPTTPQRGNSRVLTIAPASCISSNLSSSFRVTVRGPPSAVLNPPLPSCFGLASPQTPLSRPIIVLAVSCPLVEG